MRYRELYIILSPPGSNKTLHSDALGELLGFASLSWGKLRIQNPRKSKFDILEHELVKAYAARVGVILNGFPQKKDEALYILELAKRLNIKIRGGDLFKYQPGDHYRKREKQALVPYLRIDVRKTVHQAPPCQMPVLRGGYQFFEGEYA